MPSTYTYYKFGNEVFKQLPNSIQTILEKEKTFYEIGLYSPDFLFSYKANSFFERSLSIIENDKQISYILGFICHFSLDNECHSFIENYTQAYHVSKAGILAAFERKLMFEDGINRFSIQHPDYRNDNINYLQNIQPFFPEIPCAQIRTALKKRKHYPLFFIVPEQKYVVSNGALTMLFEKSIYTATEQIVQYVDVLLHNSMLPAHFFLTYSENKSPKEVERVIF